MADFLIIAVVAIALIFDFVNGFLQKIYDDGTWAKLWKATIGQVVEGLTTAPVLRDLSRRLGIELPVGRRCCMPDERVRPAEARGHPGELERVAEALAADGRTKVHDTIDTGDLGGILGATRLEQLGDTRRAAGAVTHPVDHERFLDDLPDAHARVERRVRVLEHELHALGHVIQPDLHRLV